MRKERNQPAFVAHTVAFLAELRGVSVEELGAAGGAQRGARIRLVSGGVVADEPDGDPAPVQPSLRRLRQFGIRPDRELGQNFLIDSNILGVIGRAAELCPEDVVLEIGGGLGVLSEYLAERVAHVHVVEIDRRLEDALVDAVGGLRERDRAVGRCDDDRSRRACVPSRRRSSRTSPTASPRARC